ncbi:Putative F-box protein At1g47790 [Linum perenne]
MRRLENQAKANEDNSNNGEDDDAHCSILDDDLVVSQILSRLPAKSLMRCKLVCKDWKSIIQHDSNFINLHHTRSQLRPSLFIAVRPRSPNNSNNNNNNKMRPFFSVDLHFDDGGGIGGTTIHRLTRGLKSPSEVFKYLGPVNGLLCIVDSLFAVQICNVSTGQATPWINSAVVMSRNHEGPPRCQFGFDPVTGKHKVLYLWHDRYKEAPVCEVLTVGDTRWRIIDDVPPCEIQRDYNAYVNGSIYWITFRRLGRNVPKSGHSDTLVAFDIGSEKFRMIPVPNFTLWGKYPFLFLGLIEMDGCPTVVRVNRLSGLEVKLWKFYDYGKENGTSSTTTATISDQKEQVWTDVDIILPSMAYMHIYFHPISGKDKMILEVYPIPDCGPCPWIAKNAHFYSYDMIKKTFSKFEIQGISSIPDDCQTHSATLVESLSSPLC